MSPHLAARGWQLMGHPTFVVRAPQPQPLQSAPGVRVTSVETTSQLALAERLAIEGYPLPDTADAPVGSAYPPGTLGTSLRQWVAELDGTPVGVGAAHAAHGVWNLCLAATLPEARRRGVWEALARTRLAEHPELPAAAFTSDFSRAGFESAA